jgi:small redox-active disulfide protein 2
MRIQILGTGCARCRQLLATVEQAVADLGVAAEVEKVEDLKEIMKFRILSTPGLVVDGQVKSAGRVPGINEIKGWLEGKG